MPNYTQVNATPLSGVGMTLPEHRDFYLKIHPAQTNCHSALTVAQQVSGAWRFLRFLRAIRGMIHRPEESRFAEFPISLGSLTSPIAPTSHAVRSCPITLVSDTFSRLPHGRVGQNGALVTFHFMIILILTVAEPRRRPV